jgi:hypothetical protein
MRVALVNTNRITPPVAPIGLDYVAEALSAAGHEADILDLCWEERWEPAIARFLGGGEYGLIGVTVRNTDDCSFATRESFLPTLSSMVECIRKHTGAPIVLGGVGFSIMPEAVLTQCGADAGIWGEGEFPLADLSGRLESNRPWDDLPGLVVRRDGKWRRNSGSARALTDLPPMSRSFLDNRRYFREGGQAGIETKRGCPRRCIYCADPVAKGKHVRVRTPADVADELARLVAMGIDHVHTCDSEFNIPGDHALDVCREIIRRGLGERLRWYAYCAPLPFTQELADLMRRAGCAGINFGADSGDDRMLGTLRRDFRAQDIRRTASLCREAGITVMIDLLIGAPGETRESIVRTVEEAGSFRNRSSSSNRKSPRSFSTSSRILRGAMTVSSFSILQDRRRITTTTPTGCYRRPSAPGSGGRTGTSSEGAKAGTVPDNAFHGPSRSKTPPGNIPR